MTASPLSSREARRFADSWLQEHALAAFADRVALCISELATNASLHTSRPFTVSLVGRGGAVRLEVIDSLPERVPVLVPRTGSAADLTELSETGRGLQIVSAIANRWGIILDSNVKTLWCEFDATDPVSPSAGVLDDRRPRKAKALGVHRMCFLGLPVRSAIASGLDVEDVIRDIQLLTPERRTPEVDELLALIDQTASLRLAGRHAAMHAASLDHLTFDLELEATDATLLATAQLNLALAQRALGRGRSRPSAAVIEFRNWLGDETVRQRAGETPRRYGE